ncbi:hypothetical protein [Streptomyces sp. NPDC048111]|uniref:hypothetical protein n=1 Tax=Streptomyces sp. NPDC048111 TaxID=3365500 RepID=UPI00370FDF17
MTGLRIPALRSVAALALVPAGLFATGCGIQSTDVIAVGGPASAQAMPPVDGSTVLYFTGPEGLMPVVREGPRRPPLPLLFAGPDKNERAAGIRTELPAGIRPLRTSATDALVTVTLDGDIAGLSPLAQQQIACTARQEVTRSPRTRVMIVGGATSLGPVDCPGTGDGPG